VKQDNETMRIYTAVLKAVALKCTVRVIVIQYFGKDKVKATKIYFSTKTDQETMEIYQTCFQIEFLYRDAKQFTSLITS
jgi:hypothetical protein